MSVTQQALLTHLNECLQASKIKDYCPNGLQVEGKASIQRIVTGVTGSQALIDAAIAENADAIIVHHGYFWKGEDERITGMKKKRLQALLKHDINLFAYHLPLDVHPQLGNNAQLAKRLGIRVTNGLDIDNPFSIAMQGHFDEPISHQLLKDRLVSELNTTVLSEGRNDAEINSVAWCTGGGQSFIDAAAEQGIDAFITGEVSEQTIHTSREMGIHFFAAGHHATERYGVKALGKYLTEHFDVDVNFIDIPNPA